MFEVGFSELLVIFVLALVVLGPEKLPRLAQQVGRWIGRARSMARQFREQLEDEVNLADTKKWQQPSTQQSTPPPSEATGSADQSSSAADPHQSSPPAGSEPSEHSVGQTASSEAVQGSAAEHDGGHHSGPAPAPEAAEYQPPAYSSADTPSQPSTDAQQAVESSAGETHSHFTNGAAHPDERPARPGDVITTTHERGI